MCFNGWFHRSLTARLPWKRVQCRSAESHELIKVSSFLPQFTPTREGSKIFLGTRCASRKPCSVVIVHLTAAKNHLYPENTRGFCFNPFTATGYFEIPPPRWPTFLVTLFPILKEGMGLSLLDEFEVQYHVIKMLRIPDMWWRQS